MVLDLYIDLTIFIVVNAYIKYMIYDFSHQQRLMYLKRFFLNICSLIHYQDQAG